MIKNRRWTDKITPAIIGFYVAVFTSIGFLFGIGYALWEWSA